MRCAVFGCNSDNQSKKNPLEKNIKFHRFPQDSNLCEQWLHALKRADKVNVKTATVCSRHFTSCDYKVNLKHQLLNYQPKCFRGLKNDAVPTQNLPKSSPKSSVSKQESTTDRSTPIEERNKTKMLHELSSKAEFSVPFGVGERDGVITECDLKSFISKEVQTENIKDEPSGTDLVDMRKQLEEKIKEIEKLKSQLKGVKKIFTENQIVKLNSGKRITWTANEISSAISMYSAGPRAYELSLKRGFPYPAVSTLKQWLRKKAS